MTPTFTGELQLAGWSESHTGGCKVTFWLQSPDELAAFRALTVRKGNTAGHRFMAALVEIGDDELPVHPTPVADMAIPTPREQLGDACYRTVLWCNEPKFWAWIESVDVHVSIEKEQHAKMWVFAQCEVESRKELDTDNEANKRWHREIREPYSQYLKSMERVAA